MPRFASPQEEIFMPQIFRRAIPLAALFFLGIIPPQSARAQDASNSDLASQLKVNYKLAKLGQDSNGVSVVEPGLVLVVQKGGMLGVPAISLVVPAANFKDNDLKGPSGMAKMAAGNNTKLLQIGEKVYPIKIDVDMKKDKVTVTVIECDACNGAQQPSSYKSAVSFQFPAGYLAMAAPDQIAEVITLVLAPDSDSGGGDQQQAQAPAQQEAPPPAAQEAPPPAPSGGIQVGQTIRQVLAIHGFPKQIMNVGNGQVYVYNDVLVTFVNGRVSNVQYP
jgi:hypothetical protein